VNSAMLRPPVQRTLVRHSAWPDISLAFRKELYQLQELDTFMKW
jgi:hypothetical protein